MEHPESLSVLFVLGVIYCSVGLVQYAVAYLCTLIHLLALLRCIGPRRCCDVLATSAVAVSSRMFCMVREQSNLCCRTTKLFRACDVDQSGTTSKTDFLEILRQIDATVEMKDVEDTFRQVRSHNVPSQCSHTTLMLLTQCTLTML